MTSQGDRTRTLHSRYPVAPTSSRLFGSSVFARVLQRSWGLSATVGGSCLAWPCGKCGCSRRGAVRYRWASTGAGLGPGRDRAWRKCGFSRGEGCGAMANKEVGTMQARPAGVRLRGVTGRMLALAVVAILSLAWFAGGASARPDRVRSSGCAWARLTARRSTRAARTSRTGRAPSGGTSRVRPRQMQIAGGADDHWWQPLDAVALDDADHGDRRRLHGLRAPVRAWRRVRGRSKVWMRAPERPGLREHHPDVLEQERAVHRKHIEQQPQRHDRLDADGRQWCGPGRHEVHPDRVPAERPGRSLDRWVDRRFLLRLDHLPLSAPQ